MNVKLYFLHVFVVQVISDEHNDAMTKYGAILAQGIIDAGGRSVTVSLQSRTGHTSVLAVVGMLVFTQYQYWFPLSHFLSLAFQPTAVIGLNSNLDMSAMKPQSSAKPGFYSFPPNFEEKNKDKDIVTPLVLSITDKQKKKEAQNKGKDVDENNDEKKVKIDVVDIKVFVLKNSKLYQYWCL